MQFHVHVHVFFFINNQRVYTKKSGFELLCKFPGVQFLGFDFSEAVCLTQIFCTICCGIYELESIKHLTTVLFSIFLCRKKKSKRRSFLTELLSRGSISNPFGEIISLINFEIIARRSMLNTN